MGFFVFTHICQVNDSQLFRFIHPAANDNTTVELDPDDHKHIKVLRLKVGDHVTLGNGQGKLWKARITEHGRKSVLMCTVLITEEDRPQGLHLMVAPTKNTARFEWVVEKATELGVREITPIVCEHSERVHLNANRLHRIATAATKQCQRLWLPIINEPIAFEKVILNPPHPAWIAHCAEGSKDAIHALANDNGSAIVAIGPEGDFSQQEIDEAIRSGFRALDLGTLRLRTETAAITACIAKALFNG